MRTVDYTHLVWHLIVWAVDTCQDLLGVLAHTSMYHFTYLVYCVIRFHNFDSYPYPCHFPWSRPRPLPRPRRMCGGRGVSCSLCGRKPSKSSLLRRLSRVTSSDHNLLSIDITWSSAGWSPIMGNDDVPARLCVSTCRYTLQGQGYLGLGLAICRVRVNKIQVLGTYMRYV